MKYSWWEQFSGRVRLALSVNTDVATYAEEKKKEIAEGKRQEVEEGREGVGTSCDGMK